MVDTPRKRKDRSTPPPSTRVGKVSRTEKTTSGSHKGEAPEEEIINSILRNLRQELVDNKRQLQLKTSELAATQSRLSSQETEHRRLQKDFDMLKETIAKRTVDLSRTLESISDDMTSCKGDMTLLKSTRDEVQQEVLDVRSCRETTSEIVRGE